MSARAAVAALVCIFHFGADPLSGHFTEPAELSVIPTNEACDSGGAVAIGIVHLAYDEEPGFEAFNIGNLLGSELFA